MKRYLLISTLILLFPFAVKSQESIGGIVNSYYKVVNNAAIGSSFVTCDVSEDLSTLQPGDKVLLIQMTGAKLDTTSLDWFHYDGSILSNTAGIYEFLAVSNVLGQDVYFTANLKKNYVSTEKIQLVKVYEAENAIVTSTIQPAAWNGDKGGVVALVILKKLILNAGISASGRGFRGAAAVNYSLGCRDSLGGGQDTFYFQSTYLNRSGRKGESMISTTFSYPLGMGNAYNGGGGGPGLFGGGGGGSNYGKGGNGGPQAYGCPSGFDQTGKGGISLSGTGFFTFDNFVMGGGGGSSTQYGSYTGASGGTGGGIVFILTDTLVGNGNSISAQGGSAGAYTSGGSGGGAGGSVLIDAAAVYDSPLSVDLSITVRGGNGGSSSSGTSCGSTGGGGGGGIIGISGSSLSSNIAYDTTFGSRGTSSCTNAYLGVNGARGGTKKSFKPVLNGFLFNAVNDNDTVCQGTRKQLIGSTPKGAGTTPSYSWYKSTDSLNWDLISGITSKDYLTDPLNTTTYFTRVVSSGSITDTARAIRILVYPSLSNNILTLRDTICSGASPGLLNATNVTGGNGTYSYNWQSSTNSLSWNSVGTAEEHIEGNLSNTTFYRRIVTSAKVCVDTSDIDTITVLTPIVDNEFITPDTTICFGLQAGVQVCRNISGGDGQYKYQWRVSTNNISYSTVGGASSPTYNPGVLNNTTYYKRIVFSGNDDACQDTSDARSVIVLPSITGNNISSATTLYCYNSDAEEISGQLPGGGSNVYNYQWLFSDGSQFNAITGATDQNFNPSFLTATSRYKRQVISGDDNACIDTSSELVINVVPEIINTIPLEYENICDEGTPALFTGGSATGGVGGFSYKWIRKTSSTGWEDAPGANTNTSYSSPKISVPELYSFGRIAKSSICPDTSDIIQIEVYQEITDNNIGASTQYVCYNQSKDIPGTTPLGGNGDYSYIWQSSLDASLWTDSGTSISFSATISDPAYFRRIVHSGETAQCKDTSDVIHVNINPLPTGDIVSSIDTLCAGTEIKVNYQSLTGSSPWTIELGDENTKVFTSDELNSSSGEFKFNLDKSINIKVLSILDDSSCFADLSANTGLVEAMVYNYPEADAGDDLKVCGLSAQLDATLNLGTGIWDIPSGGFFDYATLPDAIVTSDSYGTYDIIWTVSNWRLCTREDVVSVTFDEQPKEIDAGIDTSTLDYEFFLDANPASLGDGYWQKAGGERGAIFTDSTLFNTKVVLEGEGEYLFIWSIKNGVCPVLSDSILLVVQPPAFYQGFSPDGNGINDEFVIDFTEGKTATLTIFNKNGQIIWENEGEGMISWDGTTEGGSRVPDDTYYYIFVRDDNGSFKKGFIELRRQSK